MLNVAVLGLFDVYKRLHFMFDFNMAIYSKCSTITLDCDFLVSQLANSIIPVKNSVRVFA